MGEGVFGRAGVLRVGSSDRRIRLKTEFYRMGEMKNGIVWSKPMKSPLFTRLRADDSAPAPPASD
jgi:hypothetical protein